MRRIDLVVIHCAATPPDMDIGADTIDKWHRERGWAGIGYHFVVRRSGVVENGRPVQTAGAHAAGHNASSIGICLVGGVRRDAMTGKLVAEPNYTGPQWEALRRLVEQLMRSYPNAKVVGHRDLDQRKECPSFSVRDWLVSNGLHRGIEWDSGAQPAPPPPIVATKTVAGAVTSGVAGVAAVADVGEGPQQIAQAAQSVAWYAQPGTWLAAVLLVLILGGTAWAVYGRMSARRRSGV